MIFALTVLACEGPDGSSRPGEVGASQFGLAGPSAYAFECPSVVVCDFDVDCEGNEAPVIELAAVWVDGVVDGPMAEGSIVEVWVAFEDPDDNLACGSEMRSVSNPWYDRNTFSTLCGDIPSSTAATGAHDALRLPALRPGANEWDLQLSDVCGARSNRVGDAYVLLSVP